MYGKRDENSPKVPTGYSEVNPEGRPRVHMSVRGTQNDPIGGADRLGRDGMKDKYPEAEDTMNESKKHINIYSSEADEDTSSIMNESNILDLDLD
jgi:hypothetical protein